MNAIFWSFLGVWKHWSKHIFNMKRDWKCTSVSAFIPQRTRFIENVIGSTLSYPNETSKECIHFLNEVLHFLHVDILCLARMNCRINSGQNSYAISCFKMMGYMHTYIKKKSCFSIIQSFLSEYNPNITIDRRQRCPIASILSLYIKRWLKKIS